MKTIIDIAGGIPRENDILVFRKGQWAPTTKESLLRELLNKQSEINSNYEKRISQLEQDLVNLAKIVKEK